MYEELIENLRFNARQVQQYGSAVWKIGTEILLFDAADAIEELNRKVKDFEAMREISPEAEYAINKHIDSLILKLDELINSPNTDSLLKENETLKKELARYKDAEEKGYIMTPPDSGLKVYIIDKNGEIIKGNISKTSNIKDFVFDYAISIDNTTM